MIENGIYKFPDLFHRLNSNKPWDDGPVFCFTSDIDWASEAVLDLFFTEITPLQIKPTIFVTHKSAQIDRCGFDLGIHPNFLPFSSHGNSFDEVIKTCVDIVPDSKCFRTHRSFDVTDTNHILVNNYGFEYCSNIITIMQSKLRPTLHESGLINFPVFFEDGTHLYNKMDLNIMRYWKQFNTPGIKIISFHPMNFVLNTPNLQWMRSIKDTYSRDEYANIEPKLFINEGQGIKQTVLDIISLVKMRYPIMSLKEIYELI